MSEDKATYGTSYFDRLMGWHFGLVLTFDTLAEVYPPDTDEIAYMAPEMVAALRSVSERHKPLLGDYRTAYRIVCAECAQRRTEPYYNECRTIIEGADYPCPTIQQIVASMGYDEWVRDER